MSRITREGFEVESLTEFEEGKRASSSNSLPNPCFLALILPLPNSIQTILLQQPLQYRPALPGIDARVTGHLEVRHTGIQSLSRRLGLLPLAEFVRLDKREEERRRR